MAASAEAAPGVERASPCFLILYQVRKPNPEAKGGHPEDPKWHANKLRTARRGYALVPFSKGPSREGDSASPAFSKFLVPPFKLRAQEHGQPGSLCASPGQDIAQHGAQLSQPAGLHMDIWAVSLGRASLCCLSSLNAMMQTEWPLHLHCNV